MFSRVGGRDDEVDMAAVLARGGMECVVWENEL